MIVLKRSCPVGEVNSVQTTRAHDNKKRIRENNNNHKQVISKHHNNHDSKNEEGDGNDCEKNENRDHVSRAHVSQGTWFRTCGIPLEVSPNSRVSYAKKNARVRTYDLHFGLLAVDDFRFQFKINANCRAMALCKVVIRVSEQQARLSDA